MAALEKTQIRLRRTIKALTTRIRNLLREEEAAQPPKNAPETELERLYRLMRDRGLMR